MTSQLWVDVDEFLADQIISVDQIFDETLANNARCGLPSIDVSVCQGKLLQLLVRISGATRLLEIGTLGGYSALWMARGLPEGGRLVSLEIEPVHARVARQNIDRAGLSDKIDVKLGDAAQSLAELERENIGPFDLVFIDADKENCLSYFQHSLRLSRPGTFIIVDNIVRDGEIMDSQSDDVNVQGVRQLLNFVRRESRIDATALQTVGNKGHDGWLLAVVNE